MAEEKEFFEEQPEDESPVHADKGEAEAPEVEEEAAGSTAGGAEEAAAAGTPGRRHERSKARGSLTRIRNR